jgi:hypothetical protein
MVKGEAQMALNGNILNWTLKKLKIKDLTEYSKNPRLLTEKQFKQLKKSLNKFGLIDKPIINNDKKNTVIGGHQRLAVLKDSGETECMCWVPDKCISDKDIEELNIRLNKNNGDWNKDILANQFEIEDLKEWGFEDNDFGVSIPDMTDDESEKIREKYAIEIEFSNESELQAAYNKFQESGYKCKILTL